MATSRLLHFKARRAEMQHVWLSTFRAYEQASVWQMAVCLVPGLGSLLCTFLMSKGDKHDHPASRSDVFPSVPSERWPAVCSILQTLTHNAVRSTHTVTMSWDALTITTVKNPGF